MVASARAESADIILTTEKDAMRLLDLRLGAVAPTWAYLPMTVAIEPAAEFREFVSARLADAR
jgi:tetraacyldisaccharide-1-P 4'-kinase